MSWWFCDFFFNVYGYKKRVMGGKNAEEMEKNSRVFSLIVDERGYERTLPRSRFAFFRDAF